jgi:hypothetical protein
VSRDVDHPALALTKPVGQNAASRCLSIPERSLGVIDRLSTQWGGRHVVTALQLTGERHRKEREAAHRQVSTLRYHAGHRPLPGKSTGVEAPLYPGAG